MSRTIVAVGALAVSLVTSVRAAETGKTVDPTRMTCEQFVALDEDAKPRVVAWLAGYARGGRAIEEKVVAVPVQPDVASVVTACNETPKESLWQRIRAKLPSGKKTVTTPTRMTCEEFVGLGKDVQPVVAYWLDGYDEGGKGKTAGAKPGEAPAAATPIALDRDVVAVVAECRAAPKESLWDRIKRKL